MTTIRVAKRERFTTVTRATVNDKNLSFRARGVLFWLLDKPDDWSVDSEAIARDGTEGRDAVRTALKELEAAGYLYRRKWRDSDGQFRTDVWVYERPNSNALSDSGQNGFSALAVTSGNDAKEQVGTGAGNPSLVTRRRDLRPSYEDGEQTTEIQGEQSAVQAAIDACDQCDKNGWWIPPVDDRKAAARKCDHRVGALAGGQPIGGEQ